ncbi:hypothetical protein [Exiguobacterium sp. s192]|uniref:hypothetical protein n=1 Tax=Exiguobacterium sp. s192 TaxID=2751206 RepID=UPI001BE6C80C|nr:hypothetical protein [Exiguobacterium sp. s192]
MSIKENWVQAFPQSCAEDVQVVTRLLPRRWFRSTISGTIEIAYWQETLILPSRMYFDEIAEEKIHTLSQSQRWLLYCMYTRHHDGYVREKYVRRLEQEQAKTDWVLLYLIELTGEYVYEILERIEPMLQTWSEEKLKTFAAANDRYLQRVERRIISYWDVYQRTTYPMLWDSTYVGFRIAQFYRTYRAHS